MSTDIWKCYRCGGWMRTTPTQGRWECMDCKSVYLVGQQNFIRHWPEPTAEEATPLAEHNRGDK